MAKEKKERKKKKVREKGRGLGTRVGWISITSRPENLRGSLVSKQRERSSTGFLSFFFFFYFFFFFFTFFLSFLPPPSSEKANVASSPRNGNSRDTSSVSNCREVT